ncbi:MAG: Gfo/Idh/MocA family oxidoreductase [Acidobacteriaceae bacterium]
MRRLLLLLSIVAATAMPAAAAPLKVGIVGLVHEHVAAFLHGGAMVPAGPLLNRPDVELVGVVEPDQALFDRYAKRYHLSESIHFKSIAEMVARTHPGAVLVFTPPSEHRRVVEACAGLGVSVMMEKPLAFSYEDALAIKRAAERGKIHVLVDYETSWYGSNAEAASLLADGSLGALVKVVARDGHEGPQKIGVSPEFLKWLEDPKQDGDGALTDFGCYGPDLVTAMLHGEAPISVTAVTQHLQPELYPNVDDDADILLKYKGSVAIIEASWDWPFAVKQMDVYGRTGYAKTLNGSGIEVRRKGDSTETKEDAAAPKAPYDDPLHYLEAVLDGRVVDKNQLSSLDTNVTVTEILDAARRSAQTGRTIVLPLARQD